MFILKFALEVAVLAALFILIRKAFFYAVPSANPKKAEPQSSKVRGQQAVFSMVFLVFGFIASITVFWLTYFAFNVFHSFGNYSGVLITRQTALLLPSLIIGFYCSTVFSKRLFIEVFGVNEFIMEDEVRLKSRPASLMLKRVFTTFSLVAAFALLALQFNVYLKTDGQKIYTKALLEDEKVYALKEIVSVGTRGTDYVNIRFANGEKITTKAYSGNFNYFLDNISHR